MTAWFSRTDQAPLAATLGSLAMGSVCLLGAYLHTQDIQTYELLSQEDNALEWATFWAFVGAAVAFALTALRQPAAGIGLPWWAWGLMAFCAFVAGEEISWGQRVVGYVPPEYFLAENFQQEFNLHNITSGDLRTLVFEAILLGYGVLLPLAGLVPGLRRLSTRMYIVLPPALIAPGFLLAVLLYRAYPWKFTGEWAECMMAVGFLVTGIINATSVRAAQFPPAGSLRVAPKVAAAVVGAAVVGILHSQISRMMIADRPELLEAAQTELDALKTDFTSGRVMLKCDIHKRLYTFAQEYNQTSLFTGTFAQLTARGLPPTRQAYLLDPWNSPYWVRIDCDGARPLAFVYSFGPDRRRQSTREAIVADDVGLNLTAAN